METQNLNPNPILEDQNASVDNSEHDYKNPKWEDYIRYAFYAGMFSAAITTIYIIASFGFEELKTKFGIDVWSFIDVAIMLGLSFGLNKKSWVSGLFLSIYFILSKIILFESLGVISGFLSIAFIFLFIRGTWAAYKLKQHRKRTQPELHEKRKRSFLFYFGMSAGIMIGVILIGLIIIGILSPENKVYNDKDIKAEYYHFIKDNELIQDDEELIYFYSDAFFNFKNSFYFLTDKNIVLYSTEWYEPELIIPLRHINDFEYYKSESFFDDSYIKLLLHDGNEAYVYITIEENGDDRFYEKLMLNWNLENEAKGSSAEDAI